MEDYWPFQLVASDLSMVCELGRDDLLSILKEHPADKELLSPLLGTYGLPKGDFEVKKEAFGSREVLISASSRASTHLGAYAADPPLLGPFGTRLGGGTVARI